ncbi:MAG: heme exporter protein [Clostridia bacterium]|nr:heme exporter protein [Clostridia bacterium]
MNIVGQFLAIIRKDLQTEIRTKEILSSMLLFAFLTVVILNFAVDLKPRVLREVFPGFLWVVFIFTGLLGLNRSFKNEQENDCIYGLNLAAWESSIIYLAKTCSNLFFMLIMEVIIVPIFFIFFDLNPPSLLGMFILTIFLGTFGFTAVGTLIAALTANTKSNEILLPVILFPLIVPLILGVVQVTKGVFLNLPLESWSYWLKIILIFDLMYFLVPALLFTYLLEV